MTFKRVLFMMGLFLFQISLAQVTFVINQLPKSTLVDSSIYISGDFENWSGGQKAFKLARKNDKYLITLPFQKGDISYKFTQGSWDSVECNLTGNNIKNRMYSFEKEHDTVLVEIQNWNETSDIKSTANSQVTVLKNDFEIPQLNRKRRIWIYLPPDYKNSKERYPVLYMHDGQNLFNESTAYAGEWGIDETLTELYNKNQIKLIVVGIDNGQETRMNEYAPWDHSKFGIGEGVAYMQFIVNTLKPYIDTNFKTLPEKENNAIMGSSMGGLISHYAGLTYPKVFSKIGVFSPSFWYAKSCFELAKTNANDENTKMYFLVGDNEGFNMVSNVNKMIKTMKENGFDKNNIKSKIVKGGEHNEQFWRDEFKEAILWLFDKEME